MPRLPRPHLPLALVVCLACGISIGTASCGGGGNSPPPDDGWVGPCGPGDGPPVTLAGTVRYERLAIGPPGGLGSLETRPARHVDVEVRGAQGGDCYGRTHTDGTGHYSLTVRPALGATIEIAVFSRTLEAGGYDILVHEGNPPFSDQHGQTDVFTYVSGSFSGAADAMVDLTVPYVSGPPNRPSIGFAILDTFVTCWDGVVGALGGTLPTLHGYTRTGNNGALYGASFYTVGGNAIAVLGGASGLLDVSDTDYFDEAVLAHEFSHYLEQKLAHSLSRGGPHRLEGPIEPNFAWSEGQATGFGCLLLGRPDYLDSTGTSGLVLVGLSAEGAYFPNPPGIGGEFAVAEILWDLGDGAGGIPDTDGDGAAVPLSDLYAAITSFAPAADSPYIGLFLQRVVGLSTSIDAAGMDALLLGPPENQGIRYPLAGGDVWPRPILVGGADSGTVDSVTPAYNACSALSSSAWYRIDLAAPAVVTISLAITPIAGSGDNLDLYLVPNASVDTVLGYSVQPGAAPESINISLDAGVYLVRVEAECSGNRAGYDLTVN